MTKLKKIVAKIRAALADPAVAKYIPSRKVVAGAVAAALVAGLQNLTGLNLPDGYAEIVAYGLVAYFIPGPSDDGALEEGPPSAGVLGQREEVPPANLSKLPYAEHQDRDLHDDSPPVVS